MKKATISLSIIVRNEANIILDMLNSVYKIIDYYVVVDTGSTDNTKEVIANFFNNKNISGEIIDHKWKNYGDARNVALEATRGKADFAFWIDADDQLIIEPDFNIDEFKNMLFYYDGVSCEYNRYSYKFEQTSFVSTKKPWKWYGALHEVLFCENSNIKYIKELKIKQYQIGYSWSNPNKWKDYVIMIEDFIKDINENDIFYPRWIFYLAQAYLDNEDYNNAIKYYKKRTEINSGFNEEIYISLFRIGEIKQFLKYDMNEVISSYLMCTKINPERIEHFIPIIEYYISIEDYYNAYIYSSYAMKFAGKIPENTTFYINTKVYYWKIYDLHNITSWYSNRIDEAKDTFKILWNQLEKGLIDEVDEIERITYNKQFNM